MKQLTDKFDISLADLTEETYLRYFNNREIEHQVGRLMNMNKVVREIKENSIPGNFIEFGVHQGFSLMWLARFRDLYELNHKKIIGIDSFDGFPISSGPWNKGGFSNTTKEFVKETLQSQLSHNQNQNITIIESWFDDPTLTDKLELKSLALVHMDCDLKVSLESAFLIIEPYLQGTQYLLFDDWGICDDEIPAGFNSWSAAHPAIKLKMFCETIITRYYKINTIGE